jgi:hypothetical protein
MAQKFGCFNAAVTAWQIADWICAEATDPQKVALGVRGLLIYCSDYKCSQRTRISANR